MARLLYMDDELGREFSVKIDEMGTIDEVLDFSIIPLLQALGYDYNTIATAMNLLDARMMMLGGEENV